MDMKSHSMKVLVDMLIDYIYALSYLPYDSCISLL